jgi:hypothetical protein
MSEMIERVAKAILEAMDLTDGLDAESATVYARAAIEAMRITDEDVMAHPTMGSHDQESFNFVIDAALSQRKGEE